MGAIGFRGGSRRMREISLFVTVFSFLHLAYRSLPWTNFHDLYVKQRVFAQGSAFGGLDDEFSHLLPFHHKIGKFALRPTANTKGNNPGTFKDRSEMFAPKWGFLGSGNLMV